MALTPEPKHNSKENYFGEITIGVPGCLLASVPLIGETKTSSACLAGHMHPPLWIQHHLIFALPSNVLLSLGIANNAWYLWNIVDVKKWTAGNGYQISPQPSLIQGEQGGGWTQGRQLSNLLYMQMHLPQDNWSTSVLAGLQMAIA